MAEGEHRRFYHSKAWHDARELCMRLHHGLCARCLERGRYTQAEIVHHIQHLDSSNVSNPAISLSQSNLEPLCRKCHAREHPEVYGALPDGGRVAFDEFGNLVDVSKEQA